MFASLNCSLGSGDDAAKVAENRRRALDRLGLAADRLVTGYQVHGAAVALVDAAVAARGPPARRRADDADAPGIALGILTADCAPVLFADPAVPVVAAAHAGWRGAVGGVLEATHRGDGGGRAPCAARIRAGIGPCIGGASYEVGPEFPAPFLAESADNARFFATAAAAGPCASSISAPMSRRSCAASASAVERTGGDTCAEAERFFSYRRACLAGERKFGHLLAAICLAP